MFVVVLLCLGVSVSSGGPQANAEAKSRLVSASQVESWVKDWQKRLHLDDWRIEAHIVRSAELKPDTLGNLKWNSLNHTAFIKVLNPVDYDLSPGEIPEDMEYTIVHELVHLQLSVLPRDMNKRDVEETVVNKISDALMGLDKGDNFRARSVAPSKQPHQYADPANGPEVARKSNP